MSFSISGTLKVLERTGKRGPFMVAELLTDVGNFEVKANALDQFTEGSYEGLFVVDKIYQQAYTWNGGSFTKMCAGLDWQHTQIMNQSEQAEAGANMAVAEILADDDSVNAAAEPLNVPLLQVSNTPISDDDWVSDEETLSQRLASGISPIKFDGSLERELFYKLKNQVKEHGYRFDGKTQSWYLPDAAAA
ncbi:DUF3275 family protein [Stenoxybacter acetivorans]|uniref:DUF3275 family protein n=1 Tax=Stenoxybacter acetivorans TaxID=422441 RepID=UPI00055A928E|nr:DUF3275 family protein [Stenoxybacter acetivorans]